MGGEVKIIHMSNESISHILNLSSKNVILWTFSSNRTEFGNREVTWIQKQTPEIEYRQNSEMRL